MPWEVEKRTQSGVHGVLAERNYSKQENWSKKMGNYHIIFDRIYLSSTMTFVLFELRNLIWTGEWFPSLSESASKQEKPQKGTTVWYHTFPSYSSTSRFEQIKKVIIILDGWKNTDAVSHRFLHAALYLKRYDIFRIMLGIVEGIVERKTIGEHQESMDQECRRLTSHCAVLFL